MHQPLSDTGKLHGGLREPAQSEASIGVGFGVALVVPILLCCALPLLLAAGIGTVVGAAGSWLAGFGGVETVAGAVIAGAAGYGLVRWRRARLHRLGKPAAREMPAACCGVCGVEAGREDVGPESVEPVPPQAAAAGAAVLEGVSSRD